MGGPPYGGSTAFVLRTQLIGDACCNSVAVAPQFANARKRKRRRRPWVDAAAPRMQRRSERKLERHVRGRRPSRCRRRRRRERRPSAAARRPSSSRSGRRRAVPPIVVLQRKAAGQGVEVGVGGFRAGRDTAVVADRHAARDVLVEGPADADGRGVAVVPVVRAGAGIARNRRDDFAVAAPVRPAEGGQQKCALRNARLSIERRGSGAGACSGRPADCPPAPCRGRQRSARSAMGAR